MFRSFLTFATILTTGAHALFGCCWHHDHTQHHAGCEVEQAANPCVGVVEHACGCQHGCETNSSKKDPAHRSVLSVIWGETCPCGHSPGQDSAPCDEGHCQYLVNAEVQLPSVDRSSVSTILPPIVDARLLCVAFGGMQQPPHLSASLLSGSLCVRDLTQIALI